jgi:preprotein translocase subunit YajC
MLNTILLQAANAGGSPYSSLIFIVLIILVFYFFMIRPQQQQQKKLREERNNMQKGDHVITSGGLYGKIEGVKTGQPNKKGVAEVESFLISLKPDYNVTILVSKECVFKDLNDVAAAQQR